MIGKLWRGVWGGGIGKERHTPRVWVPEGREVRWRGKEMRG